MGKVDGLGNRIVGVILECGLHPHVPFGGNVVGRPEQINNPLRHSEFRAYVLQAAGPGYLLHQLIGIETLLQRHGLEVRVHLKHPGVVHHVAFVAQRKQRLYAA